MKFSTKGRYAVRMMLDLAMQPTTHYIPLRDIAERQNISIKYLEQITARLHRANLVNSSRGNTGGYMLIKKPEEYTLGEILRASEGSLSPVSCLDGCVKCENEGKCNTKKFWYGLYRQMTDYVDNYTLADLIEEAKANQAEKESSEV